MRKENENLSGVAVRWRKCGIATLLAVPALAVLIFVDSLIKSRTGAGIMDWQHAQTTTQLASIAAGWDEVDRTMLLVGFSIGFDYLFIALYGYALWNGAYAARDSFAPVDGMSRNLLFVLLLTVPIVIALDASENVLSLVVLFGNNLSIAPILLKLFSVKWFFAYTSISYVALTAIAYRLDLLGARSRLEA